MGHKAAKAERKAEKAKMWKVNVQDYMFEGRTIGEDGIAKTQKMPYRVKESLASMLFLADLKLSIEDAFKAKDLADKIRESNNSVLLDSGEMTRLRQAYNLIKSPGEHELEFFKRIRDAEQVEVAETAPEVK